MFECMDENGYTVQLLFKQNSFAYKATDVLVLTKYKGQWLLTKHAKRGLEFPGGKVERGESIEEAATREVYEETGGVIEELECIGEYYVHDPNNPFVKAVFTANVKRIERKVDYLETNGPVLIDENLLSQLHEQKFSFMMRDEVMKQLVLFAQNERTPK